MIVNERKPKSGVSSIRHDRESNTYFWLKSVQSERSRSTSPFRNMLVMIVSRRSLSVVRTAVTFHAKVSFSRSSGPTNPIALCRILPKQAVFEMRFENVFFS
jgi:hypothetical protein